MVITLNILFPHFFLLVNALYDYGIYVLVGVLFCGIIFALRLEGKRIQNWKQEAERLGFTYYEENSTNFRCEYRFYFFRDIALIGESKGTQLVLGDYTYMMKNNRNPNKPNPGRAYRQTICAVMSPDVDIPHFFLRKEKKFSDFLGKNIWWPGYQF